jgi:hypothetical protein
LIIIIITMNRSVFKHNSSEHSGSGCAHAEQRMAITHVGASSAVLLLPEPLPLLLLLLPPELLLLGCGSCWYAATTAECLRLCTGTSCLGPAETQDSIAAPALLNIHAACLLKNQADKHLVPALTISAEWCMHFVQGRCR